MFIATDQRAASGIPLAEGGVPGPVRSLPAEESGFGAAFAMLAVPGPIPAATNLEIPPSGAGHGAGDASGTSAPPSGGEGMIAATVPSGKGLSGLGGPAADTAIALANGASGVARPQASADLPEDGSSPGETHTIPAPKAPDAQDERNSKGVLSQSADATARPGHADKSLHMAAPAPQGAFSAVAQPAHQPGAEAAATPPQPEAISAPQAGAADTPAPTIPLPQAPREAAPASAQPPHAYPVAPIAGEGPDLQGPVLQPAIEAVTAGQTARESAPPPPGGATPPPIQLVLRQVAGALVPAVAPGGQAHGMAELALSPPELGSVRMLFAVTEAGLSVQIAADRPETQDLLRRNADLLLRDLREAGQSAVTLDFSGGDGRHRSPPPAPEATVTAQFTADAATLAPPSQPYGPAAARQSGQLDLRI